MTSSKNKVATKRIKYIAEADNREGFINGIYALQARSLWIRYLKAWIWDQWCKDGNDELVRAFLEGDFEDMVNRGGELVVGEPWLNYQSTILRGIGLSKFDLNGAKLLSQEGKEELARDIAIFEAQGARWSDVASTALISVNRRFVKGLWTLRGNPKSRFFGQDFVIGDGDYWKWSLKPRKSGLAAKPKDRYLQSGGVVSTAQTSIPNCGKFTLKNLGSGNWSHGQKMERAGQLKSKGGLTLHLGLKTGYLGRSSPKEKDKSDWGGGGGGGGGGGELLPERVSPSKYESNNDGYHYPLQREFLFGGSDIELEDVIQKPNTVVLALYHNCVFILEWAYEPPEG